MDKNPSLRKQEEVSCDSNIPNRPVDENENPKDIFDVQAVDDLVKKEINQLSFRERYLLNQDVQGMNVLACAEPAELSSLGLEALDKQLRKFENGRYRYYRLAEKLNSRMIRRKDFRLKFARADCFDPVKAANRMEMYLKILCENFGNEALMRPVTLTDLLDKVSR